MNFKGRAKRLFGFSIAIAMMLFIAICAKKSGGKMKFIYVVLFLLPSLVFAEGSDYWSKNKTMNLPSGVATTSCSFFNRLDKTAEETVLMHEIYKRWLKGWVSSFAMYSDWDIRDIEDAEYLDFIEIYCVEFPRNTIGMAAHTFTFRVKK